MSVADIAHTKWEFHSLSSIIELIGGGTPKTSIPEYWNGDIPWLSVNDFAGDSRYVSSTEKHITQAGLDNSSAKLLCKGDIIISARGTIGELAQLSEPMAFNQSCYGIRGISTKIDQAFLYYLLRIVVNDLRKSAHGSVFSTITRNTFESIEVPLPPLTNQNRIAKVLGSLDDKIAGNNKMIRIILELQKSIWIQNNVNNLSQTHLINIAEPILGGTPKRSDNSLWNGDILWASVADMTSVSNSHLLTTAEQITEKAAKTKRFAPLPAGSVLLSARGTVGHVISLAKPAAFNQSAYGFIAPKGYETALRLAIEGTVEELKSKSYGSVFSTITKQQINECLIPDVFNESFAELHAKLNSLETRIVIAEQENQTLARTRDELLPLLMSGKITVRDAEEASAEVGVDKHEVEE